MMTNQIIENITIDFPWSHLADCRGLLFPVNFPSNESSNLSRMSHDFNVGKTIINHPPVTMFTAGMFTIPSHGLFILTLFYPH